MVSFQSKESISIMLKRIYKKYGTCCSFDFFICNTCHNMDDPAK